MPKVDFFLVVVVIVVVVVRQRQPNTLVYSILAGKTSDSLTDKKRFTFFFFHELNLHLLNLFLIQCGKTKFKVIRKGR